MRRVHRHDPRRRPSAQLPALQRQLGYFAKAGALIFKLKPWFEDPVQARNEKRAQRKQGQQDQERVAFSSEGTEGAEGRACGDDGRQAKMNIFKISYLVVQHFSLRPPDVNSSRE